MYAYMTLYMRMHLLLLLFILFYWLYRLGIRRNDENTTLKHTTIRFLDVTNTFVNYDPRLLAIIILRLSVTSLALFLNIRLFLVLSIQLIIQVSQLIISLFFFSNSHFFLFYSHLIHFISVWIQNLKYNCFHN